MAQRLQVVFVREQLHVSIVWDDVVDVCRLRPPSMPRAFPAVRLDQQLSLPQSFPHRKQVHPVPHPGFCATPVNSLRLVLIAIPRCRQRSASCMQARAQRFVWHCSHLRKNKKSHYTIGAQCENGVMALALWLWLERNYSTLVFIIADAFLIVNPETIRYSMVSSQIKDTLFSFPSARSAFPRLIVRY